MKDNQMKNIVEVIGIIAVVISLIFVALEIRQNTYALRAASIQSIADMSLEATMGLSMSADLREAYLAMGDPDISDDQAVALDAWLNGLMRIQEMRYIQSEIGAIQREDLGTVGARNRIYRAPYIREYWAERKSEYSTGFQEYMEREVFSDRGESDE